MWHSSSARSIWTSLLCMAASSSLQAERVSLQLLPDPWDDGSRGKHWPLPGKKKMYSEKEKQAFKKPSICSWAATVDYYHSLFADMLHVFTNTPLMVLILPDFPAP